MNKQAKTLWLTGLPCSGKTTIAKRLEKELENKGYKVAHLDGDDVREGLNKDLGFSREDRKENLRRIAHIAELLDEKANIDFVIASFVSPRNEYREMIKNIIKNMKLIYVKCSVEECERRDVKGMYKKARNGEIDKFTGISAPFEEPNADLIVDSENEEIETCVNQILNSLNSEKS